jgi:integrase
MARKIKSATLDTRAARLKLAPKGKPYPVPVGPDVSLGYRRLSGQRDGTWSEISYLGNRKYKQEMFGYADDYSDADNAGVFDYWQAFERVRKKAAERRVSVAGLAPYLMSDCLADYIRYLDAEKKTASDGTYSAEALILPQLGEVDANKLTTARLEQWRDELARTPGRLRTRKGEPQKYADMADAEAVRSRRATVNRVMGVLKAALNRAWRAGHIRDDSPWRRLSPFGGVSVARVRYLTIDEGRRLLNACDPDFRDLVRAALASGCRYGELTRLVNSDYDKDSSTLLIRTSKSGKSRRVVLAGEGVAFFAALTAGKPTNAMMLTKADGSAWKRSHQVVPIKEALSRARIEPTGFHTLRHTYCSHAIMNGAPLLAIACNLGHADTKMIEAHYGHLSQTYIADAIKQAAPSFGYEDDRKVVSI